MTRECMVYPDQKIAELVCDVARYRWLPRQASPDDGFAEGWNACLDAIEDHRTAQVTDVHAPGRIGAAPQGTGQLW